MFSIGLLPLGLVTAAPVSQYVQKTQANSGFAIPVVNTLPVEFLRVGMRSKTDFVFKLDLSPEFRARIHSLPQKAVYPSQKY